jgi:hypothetical protein
MNVSITEDATMSRTRLETGATVVRVDAIVRVSAQKPALQEKELYRRLPFGESMSELHQSQYKMKQRVKDVEIEVNLRLFRRVLFRPRRS